MPGKLERDSCCISSLDHSPPAGRPLAAVSGGQKAERQKSSDFSPVRGARYTRAGGKSELSSCGWERADRLGRFGAGRRHRAATILISGEARARTVDNPHHVYDIHNEEQSGYRGEDAADGHHGATSF